MVEWKVSVRVKSFGACDNEKSGFPPLGAFGAL